MILFSQKHKTRNQPNTTTDAHHYFTSFLHLPLWNYCCQFLLIPLGSPTAAAHSKHQEVFWLRHHCSFSFLWRLTLEDWVQRGRHSTIQFQHFYTNWKIKDVLQVGCLLLYLIILKRILKVNIHIRISTPSLSISCKDIQH